MAGRASPRRRLVYRDREHRRALELLIGRWPDFIGEGHLERHVRRMRRLYKRRREVLLDAIDRHLGDAATVSGDAAGLYLLVRFASGAIPARARRNRVRLASTDRCYLTAAPPHEFALCFGGIGERTIREGIRRLASHESS